MNYLKTSFLFILCLVIFPLGCGKKQEEEKPPATPMEGRFWKDQAINDIIIPWTQNGMNEDNNTFPTYMERDWEPFQGTNKYPGMISRHIFSYSTAYLLTGEDRYLNIAARLVQYMIQNGWDRQNRLWFNEIDGSGNPVDGQKDMFMQLYAVTGLSMYYVVTRDERIYDYVTNSIDLINENAWDEEEAGYVNILNRDLSVDDNNKKATPQLAPLSGYLAYLYPATGNEDYLNQMERGVDLVTNRLMNDDSNWLLESFNKFWYINEEGSSKINVGHNQEIVWMLLRMHLLTGNEAYKEQALELYPQLFETAFNKENGSWYHNFPRQNPDQKPDSTPWWIQAYGNMLELYMYRITGEQKHIDRFKKGAAFWNENFIDKEYGGAVLKANIEGGIADGNKAVRSKTSYHSMEHGLLNYLYLNYWVEEKPVTLHFKINSSNEGDTFSPRITEDPQVQISSVQIDGESWDQFNAQEGTITLPSLNNGNIEVQMTRKK